MFLPPIKFKGSESQLSSRRKIGSLNNHFSQKNISPWQAANKQRCYTEPKQNYIGKKLMNYIDFERVKSLKSYAQICQENLQKFHQEKKEMKSMRASRCYIESQIKQSKLALSPRGNGVKIHLKTDKSVNQKEITRRRKDYDSRQRMQTQVVRMERGQLKARLKKEARGVENNCLSIKKYSQMSIREIIQKDLALQPKKILQFYNSKPCNHLEGW